MKRPHRLLLSALFVGASAWLSVGCNNSSPGANTGSGGGSGASSGSGGTSGAGGVTDGSFFDGAKIQPGMTQCTDGIDNDNDGLIDAADPDCTGPLDNDESSFATGIPGDNMDPCKQDCFFDGNSGQGDDGCDWNLKCDPASPGGTSCPYNAGFNNCPTTQSQMCVNFCTALTPNGCDCFGCCVISGVDHPVYLASTCSFANINDTTKCPACTQNTACTNTCGHCELCFGQTTLPADCTPDSGTPTPTCSNNYQACVPTQVDPTGGCPSTAYCLSGCCIPYNVVP